MKLSSYWDYLWLCYTFDVSVVPNNTTVSASGWYYTTLPYPHFDMDDDPEPNGNGYFDETEVTVMLPPEIGRGSTSLNESRT